MDPITVIVTALATGAAAGVGATAEQGLKDAYEGLKTFVKKKYRQVQPEKLEAAPASPTLQKEVKEGLEEGNAGSDPDLLRLARTLIELVQERAPDAAERAGITIKALEAQSLYLKNIEATGGLLLDNSKVRGDVRLEDLTLGRTRSKG